MKASAAAHAIAGGKVRIGERIAQQRIGEEVVGDGDPRVKRVGEGYG